MKTALLTLVIGLLSSTSHATVFCGKNYPGIQVIRMSELPKSQQSSVADWKQYLKDSGEKVLKTCKDNGNTVIVSQDHLNKKWAVIFDHLQKASFVAPSEDSEANTEATDVLL